MSKSEQQWPRTFIDVPASIRFISFTLSVVDSNSFIYNNTLICTHPCTQGLFSFSHLLSVLIYYNILLSSYIFTPSLRRQIERIDCQTSRCLYRRGHLQPSTFALCICLVILSSDSLFTCPNEACPFHVYTDSFFHFYSLSYFHILQVVREIDFTDAPHSSHQGIPISCSLFILYLKSSIPRESLKLSFFSTIKGSQQ